MTDTNGIPEIEPTDPVERPRGLGHTIFRIGKVVLGAILVIVGLALVPLPGPGWLIVIAGLALMAEDVPIARRAMDALKAKLERLNKKVRERR